LHIEWIDAGSCAVIKGFIVVAISPFWFFTVLLCGTQTQYHVFYWKNRKRYCVFGEIIYNRIEWFDKEECK